MSIIDGSTRSKIYLDIRESATYRVRCTFSGCGNRTQGLHDVTRQVRFNVMKHNNGARACNEHLLVGSWNNIGNSINQRNRFSKQQIEDLIQLLRDSDSRKPSEFPNCTAVQRIPFYSWRLDSKSS